MATRRTGLGRNLSALLGDHTSHLFASFASAPTDLEITMVAINQLQPGKYQPRTFIDQHALTQLAQSIKRQGLLQPLIVRAVGNHHYEIIAGERRWHACKLAGLTTVAVIIKTVDDETAMALALIENLQREGLNPIDYAKGLATLINEFKLTHQQAADLLATSRTAVSNYLRLLTLSDQVMAFLFDGRLDMGHGRALLVLDNENQLKMANTIVEKQLSVRQTEQLVSRLKQLAQTESLIDSHQSVASHSSTIKAKLASLELQLQAKIKLKSGKAGKGTLIIHYQSSDELETMMTKMIN